MYIANSVSCVEVHHFILVKKVRPAPMLLQYLLFYTFNNQLIKGCSVYADLYDMAKS